jgi:ectoine hydroxylase
LFYGYSYRWFRPRDDVTMDHWWDRLDPIRKQLFGNAPTGGYGFTSPTDEDVPLRGWLSEHLGEEAVA